MVFAPDLNSEKEAIMLHKKAPSESVSQGGLAKAAAPQGFTLESPKSISRNEKARTSVPTELVRGREQNNQIETPRKQSQDYFAGDVGELASEHRMQLAADAQVLDLALDASESEDHSLEEMQSHLMALQYRLAMTFGARAQTTKDIKDAAMLAKASLNATRSFQQGLDGIHRARRGGRQVVTVQHVNVNEGGQAVITAGLHEKKR